MARLARLVVPHHVTQRGNRRERVFFGDGDYRAISTWKPPPPGPSRPEGAAPSRRRRPTTRVR